MLQALLAMAGMGVNIASQQSAMSQALAQLQFAKQQAAEQQRLGTAGRVDALGNKQVYNRATNTWETVLTPLQRQITQAGETEQYRSLTEDAARNRQVKERTAAMGKQASEDFKGVRANYLYDQPEGEGAIKADLTRLIGQSKADAARGQGLDLATTSIRQGRGALLSSILNSVDKKVASGVGDTLLQARQGAVGESAQRSQAHESKYLPALQQLGALAQQGSGADVNFSDIMKYSTATQGAAAKDALGAYANSMAGPSYAGQNVTKLGSQQLIDPRMLEMIVKGMQGGGGGSLGTPYTPPLPTDPEGRVGTAYPGIGGGGYPSSNAGAKSNKYSYYDPMYEDPSYPFGFF